MLIRAIPREDLPEELVPVYDLCVERAGDTDFVQAGANAPEVLDWYFNSFYRRVFYEGRVDVRIKEIVRLRLSKTHGCAFCNRWNTIDARSVGVEQDVIDGIRFWPDAPDAARFTDRELAALRYADQMVLQNMDGHLDPLLYADLREHFTDAEIFELGVTMAVLTGMAKFLFIADLVPKEANCPVPGGSART
jgi:alkylhydroperoxidase family enzyme